MIKLSELISEAYMHPLYGSDTEHFFVKRPYDLYIAAGGKEATGQWSTAGPGGNKMIYRDKATKVKVLKGMQISNLPGGVFLIDKKRKTAYRIITKKGGTGKPNNLEKIPPRGHTNYVDYSMWKRWLNTND
tara:strand:+ start:68 stop:460 length:393 start_codon:yes stop_codon:yes gene_type:complete